jgi:hypothetical protein
MAPKLQVIYYDDALAIMYGDEEVLYWSMDEWVDDPQILFCIVNACVTAMEDKEAFLKEHWYYHE